MWWIGLIVIAALSYASFMGSQKNKHRPKKRKEGKSGKDRQSKHVKNKSNPARLHDTKPADRAGRIRAAIRYGSAPKGVQQELLRRAKEIRKAKMQAAEAKKQAPKKQAAQEGPYEEEGEVVAFGHSTSLLAKNDLDKKLLQDIVKNTIGVAVPGNKIEGFEEASEETPWLLKPQEDSVCHNDIESSVKDPKQRSIAGTHLDFFTLLYCLETENQVRGEIFWKQSVPLDESGKRANASAEEFKVFDHELGTGDWVLFPSKVAHQFGEKGGEDSATRFVFVMSFQQDDLLANVDNALATKKRAAK